MRRTALLAITLVASVLLASCGILPRWTSGPTQQPSAATRSAPSARPSLTPSQAVSSSDQAHWPFAGYDPAAHAVFADAPTSPDRQTSITSQVKPPGFADAPPGSGIQRYVDQKIAWTSCEQGECGSVLVPLNWDDPDGQAITVAVFRKKAVGEHRGSLFVNPGGPGVAGIPMAQGFDGSPFPGFDIVGWDPRGSGESTPVVCGTDAQTDALNALDQSPDTDAEWTALVKGYQQFAAQCRQNSGALLDHISTLDNVRDLDYLRYLMGDQKLTYLGVSYGTYIGAVYAELFPQRAGALVLDSAVNITDKDSVIQAMGFDLALKAFADWCVAEKGQECELGNSQAAVISSLTDYFAARDAQPLTVQGRVFNDSSAVMGVAGYLYSGEKAYESLYNTIMWALKGNKPDYLQSAGDWLIGREQDGRYGSLAYSFPAIGCADSQDFGLAKARTQWSSDAAKAPIFGQWMGPGVTCPTWTAKPMPALKLTAKGAAPILVLGATGDPATPYQQAEWMADQLDSGVLVGWKGAGHSTYSLGNACVKDIVHAFVNQATVPTDGTMC